MYKPVKLNDFCFSVLLLLVCSLISSCVKQPVPTDVTIVSATNNEDIQKKSALLDFLIQQEAMLIDIPLPLYDERIISESDDIVTHDTLVLGYKSPLTQSAAINFFMNQMERYGW